MADVRVAVYVRVSTRDKGQDVMTQLMPLRTFIERMHDQGWTLYKEYVDDGASAGDFGARKAWRELLEDSRLRKFDIVLVLRLDRAFRSVKATYDTLALLNERGIGFKSLTQDIDTSSATGNLLLGILAAVAEFESALIRERVVEGMERAKAEGKNVGRPKGATDEKKRSRRGYLLRYAK